MVSGCTVQNQTAAGSGMVVATSISPLADLIRQVGGERIQVINLVPRGTDPHNFEPKSEDLRRLAVAKAFFANGVGEEPYIDKLLANAGNPGLRKVVLSDGLPILQAEKNNPGNPHLWLDVHNAEQYVQRIRDTLDDLAPASKSYFDQNAAAYLAELEELDRWIAAQIATIPPEARLMVVFHDAWPYYAQRYGLTILRPVVHNNEAEPSAGEYAELVNLIRQKHVRAVFGESGFNPKLVQRLASDTGVTFVGNLYDDTLGDSPENNSYLAIMRSNTAAIVEALR